MPNAKLAQEILDQITQNPDSFNMGTWFDGVFELTPNEPVTCGTTLCVGGWAVHLSGWTLTLAPTGDESYYDDRAGDEQLGPVCVKDGETQFVSVVAKELLGLDDVGLFYNPPRCAIGMLRQIAAGQQPDHSQCTHPEPQPFRYQEA